MASVAFAVDGEISVMTGGPSVTVTCAVAEKLESTALVAVTVTDPSPGTDCGAE
jgi:hypothetical protein